jgi:hypothetical protein
MSRIRTALVGTVAAGLLLMSAGVASAETTTKVEFDNIALGNSWWLESPTEITTDVSESTSPATDETFSAYSAQIRQPINPDGTSTWPSKRGVIPVQFNLTASPTTETTTTTKTTTAVTKVPSFQSIYSDGASNGNEWSALTYVPPANTKVGDINALIADYSWINGTNHGGSLRWQINTSAGSIHVFYGPHPNFDSNAGLGTPDDLADATDDRVDTSQVGGTQYDNWANVRSSQFASLGVDSIALTIDGGWKGDQEINLMNVLVITGSTSSSKGIEDSYSGAPDIIDPDYPTSTTYPAWVPGAPLVETDEDVEQVVGAPVPTNEIPAFIKVERQNVDPTPDDVIEPLSSAQGDTTGQFRQIDGKYMYNLKAETLGKGSFKVYMVIDGNKVEPAPGVFELR